MSRARGPLLPAENALKQLVVELSITLPSVARYEAISTKAERLCMLYNLLFALYSSEIASYLATGGWWVDCFVPRNERVGGLGLIAYQKYVANPKLNPRVGPMAAPMVLPVMSLAVWMR